MPGSPAKIVVITGPTASGKTERALEWAEDLSAEIVNADSQQVYRYMDIGTAKPTPEARARVAHHLLDVVNPDEPYHAGRFEREARAAIAQIRARGRAVFVVGGSGLYLRALLEGLAPAVGRAPAVRQRLEDEDARARAAGDEDFLHRRLAKSDPRTAARLHPNDSVRLIRALEIFEQTGRPASELRARADEPRFDALLLGLDPGSTALRARIEKRCDAMLDAGLLQEVRALRERGYGPELASMRAIGYRHMQPVLDGAETLAGVRATLAQDTWQFARRQRTWLRRVRGLQTLHPDAGASLARARIAQFLEAAP